MKKSLKITLITAAGVIAAGIILFAVALGAAGFNPERFNTMKFETKTNSITDKFSNIDIVDASGGIVVKTSEDNTCSVICRDSDSVYHTVAVEGDTLSVKLIDERRWYEYISIFWNTEPAVEVYLPESEYNSLSITNSSGSIKVDCDSTFEKTELRNSSGRINFAGNSNELSAKNSSGGTTVSGSMSKLSVTASSGSISVEKMTEGDVSLSTSSGAASISGSDVDTIFAETSSGSIRLNSVTASGDAEVKSSSGGIHFDRFDAASIKAKASSGSVTGTLLSAKCFSTHSSSGGVDVPESDSEAGKCEITTSSGRIKIELVK